MYHESHHGSFKHSTTNKIKQLGNKIALALPGWKSLNFTRSRRIGCRTPTVIHAEPGSQSYCHFGLSKKGGAQHTALAPLSSEWSHWNSLTSKVCQQEQKPFPKQYSAPTKAKVRKFIIKLVRGCGWETFEKVWIFLLTTFFKVQNWRLS